MRPFRRGQQFASAPWRPLTADINRAESGRGRRRRHEPEHREVPKRGRAPPSTRHDLPFRGRRQIRLRARPAGFSEFSGPRVSSFEASADVPHCADGRVPCRRGCAAWNRLNADSSGPHRPCPPPPTTSPSGPQGRARRAKKAAASRKVTFAHGTTSAAIRISKIWHCRGLRTGHKSALAISRPGTMFESRANAPRPLPRPRQAADTGSRNSDPRGRPGRSRRRGSQATIRIVTGAMTRTSVPQGANWPHGEMHLGELARLRSSARSSARPAFAEETVAPGRLSSSMDQKSGRG